ncbi:Polyphosphate kinase 2 (PPK2) [Microbacterium oxydans]|uniref:ADP/GDP-polyphosphate phosphotransferase n=1 Tax=Microbacterium oxydans TaxID=82380 RepID=A0A0F0KR29_9MICO|nr:polyphosphate kinase 2 [Microbacterium oxydans]KJL23367.1 Polyphosphate kinase 2 (PPK2) [Microbacterium oxydans]
MREATTPEATAPEHDDRPDEKLARAVYEREKRLLQVELLKLQAHIKRSSERVLVLFEGRDAAGKGGAITRFMEHLNPRGARVVALDKPSDIERTQWYFQRYVAHLPSGGEIVLMDRSWYNRAGVERVMGYCSSAEYEEFIQTVPQFERMLVGSGMRLIKLWFSVSEEEQRRRFARRGDDAVKQWKLSSTDVASIDRWADYTAAEEAMFLHTDTPALPWLVIRSDDKRRARLEAMRCVLARFEYPGKDPLIAHAPDPRLAGRPSQVDDDERAPSSPA